MSHMPAFQKHMHACILNVYNLSCVKEVINIARTCLYKESQGFSKLGIRQHAHTRHTLPCIEVAMALGLTALHEWAPIEHIHRGDSHTLLSPTCRAHMVPGFSTFTFPCLHTAPSCPLIHHVSEWGLFLQHTWTHTLLRLHASELMFRFPYLYV